MSSIKYTHAQVDKYCPPESDDEYGHLWRIKYEDGDIEDMDAAEVITLSFVVVDSPICCCVFVDIEKRSGVLSVHTSQTRIYLYWSDDIPWSK